MNRAGKYLFVLPTLGGGGAERMTLLLIDRLRKSGMNIDLLLFKDIREYDIPNNPDMKILSIVSPGEKIFKNLHKFLPRFIRIAKKYDVLIGGLELWPSYMVSIAGHILKKKIVWIVHTSLSSYIKSNRYPRYHMYLTRIFAKFADKVITVSQKAGEDLSANFGIGMNRIEVIYNPNDLQSIRKLSKEQIPPEEECIFARPTIVSAGRLSMLKGFDILISAVKKVRDSGIDCNLLLLGEGDDRDKLLAISENLGIADRVFMPGFKANPYRYFARSSVFVLPSRLEGFGIVIVEAMACGCPVIATDCPSGPSEILSGGKYGHLIDVDDTDGMASAISSLLSNAEERDRYRGLGVNRAEDFNAEKSVKRYMEELASI